MANELFELLNNLQNACRVVKSADVIAIDKMTNWLQ